MMVQENYRELITEGVEIEVRKMNGYFDVIFRDYIIRINDVPYYARMAVYSLLMIEKKLLANGYVEDVIPWDEKEWTVWDPHRIFIMGEFKIFRKGNYKIREGDALIDLKVKRLYAPLSENQLKIFVKAFMMPAPVIE